MKKSYYVKIGMMLLDITDNESVMNSIISNKSYSDPEQYHAEICAMYSNLPNVLIKSPYISNIEWIRSPSYIQSLEIDYYSIRDNYYLPEAPTYLKFKCRLPKKNRKYYYNVKHLEVIEEFNVMYNGVYFILYIENHSEMETQYLGPEVRELLKKALISQYWKPRAIVPCPMIQDFVIHNHNSMTNGFNAKVFTLKALDDSFNNIELTLDSLFQMLSASIQVYYEACIIQHEYSDDIQFNINLLISEMSAQMNMFLDIESYDLTKKYSIMKDIVKNSCNFQLLCNEYNDKYLEVERYKEMIKNKPSLLDHEAAFANALADNLNKTSFSIEDKRETVKFIQSIVAGAYTNYATIFSGLIGALVGGVIGTYIGGVLGK